MKRRDLASSRPDTRSPSIQRVILDVIYQRRPQLKPDPSYCDRGEAVKSSGMLLPNVT